MRPFMGLQAFPFKIKIMFWIGFLVGFIVSAVIAGLFLAYGLDWLIGVIKKINKKGIDN